MATINYFIQTQNSPARIYVRLREGRKIDAKAKTSYAINPEDWSILKGQPKNLKDDKYKKLNEDLTKLRTDILSYYNNSVGRTEINSAWLKGFLFPENSTSAVPDKLIRYFDYYTSIKKDEVAASTYIKLRVYKHLLERFQEASGREYLIRDVNFDFKLRFEAYCRQEKYSQNTIARTIKSIKTICYHARNNGVETHYQLNSISYKVEKVEKIYLTTDEVERIEKAELTLDYHINARDWLLISCETGQRVSDFMNFTKEKIRFEGNVPLIEFTQVKTKKIMSVPLSRKVRAILDKRNGNFPRKISSQHYNDYIKEVCRIAGLTDKISGSRINPETNRKEKGLFPKYKLVTSHIGRRSFATNYYGKIPTSLLIGATGHSTEKMFLEYIGKTETEKAKQLAEYFN